MNKILITGGAGFIGFHLARLLAAQEEQVDVLDNFDRGVHDYELEALLALPNVNLVQADLLQPAELAELSDDYHYIYHLAARLGVANVLQQPFRVLADNTMMLLNTLQLASHQRQLKRFLFSSTSEVYAGTLQHFELPFPTPETTPLALTDLDHPRTSYMLSKIYGEALCLHSDLPVTLIRPHNIYGPRMGLSHVIPELLERADKLAADAALTVYSADHSRTFCYIDDAVRMIHQAAVSEACLNQTLNIGSQTPEITMGELARLILATVDKDGSELATQPAAPNSPPRRCPDMAKTLQLTGYSAKTDLAEGIRQTYDWYKTHVFHNEGVFAR